MFFQIKTSVFILICIGLTASDELGSLKCDFEKGICDFLSNDKSNKEFWRKGSGQVNNSEDTGPIVDHTLGNSKGSYIYVDSRKAKRNPVKLITKVLDVDYCIRFFYHMYGTDVGELTASAESVHSSEIVQYFYKNGAQGDRWVGVQFHVTRTSDMSLKGYRVSIVAKGRSDSSTRGNIALDDMELIPGKCKETKRDAFKLCSFDYSDCGYTSTKKVNRMWQWKNETVSPSSELQEKPIEDHTLGTRFGGYWFFGDTRYAVSYDESVVLSTPIYEKPGNLYNCLIFYVYLKSWGDTEKNYVEVVLDYPYKNSKQHVVTKSKTNIDEGVWTYVEKRIEIFYDFQIEFTAGLITSNGAIAALDDVVIIEGICPNTGFCDFEKDKCSFSDSDGDYDWMISDGLMGIGPTTDHTKGNEKGKYIVFNSAHKGAGSTASIQTEFFPPNGIFYCINFFYYMKGKDLGKLEVIVQQNDLTKSTIWTMKGEQGDQWIFGKVPLRPNHQSTWVIFQGTLGKGKNAYMALDDIHIRKGDCTVTPSPPENPLDPPEKGSNKGLIFGVVIGIILLIAISLAIWFKSRRNRTRTI